MPIVLSALFFLLSITPAFAQESTTEKNLKPSIEERLIRLDEGQKNIQIQIDNTNKRIDDLRADINNRFDDLKSKFGWLYILLSSIIALNGVMVGSVIWLARQDRPIGQRHYDLLLENDERFESEISRLSKDLRLIKARLELSE
jgi:hypothetical protein